MKEQKIRFTPIPSTAEVEAERERLAYRSRYMRVLRSTVYTLLVVAAIAVLLATLFLPVLQVSGDSMNHSAGLVDHVDIVDDGACTGEDAGNGVEHLTDIQEAVVSVAGTTVQIDHFLFADGGIVCGQFHSRHGDFPFY